MNARENLVPLMLLGLTVIACLAACASGGATPGSVTTGPGVREAIQTVEDCTAPWQQRLQAVSALQKKGSAAVEAIPALVRVLGDTDENLREAAARALGEIGSENGVVRALTRALGDDSSGVRRVAARALYAFGPQAVAAVPTLVQNLQDEQARGRSEIVGVLGAIGPQEDVVPVLIQLFLQDRDRNVRGHTAVVLASIGRAEDVVPVFIQGLLNDPGVRWIAAEKLWRIGPKAAQAVPALVQVLNDGCVAETEEACDVERYAVVRALHAITGQDLAEDALAWQAWWEAQP